MTLLSRRPKCMSPDIICAYIVQCFILCKYNVIQKHLPYNYIYLYIVVYRRFPSYRKFYLKFYCMTIIAIHYYIKVKLDKLKTNIYSRYYYLLLYGAPGFYSVYLKAKGVGLRPINTENHCFTLYTIRIYICTNC